MYNKLEVPTDAKYIVVLAVQEVTEVLEVLHGNEFARAQEVAEQAVADWLSGKMMTPTPQVSPILSIQT